MLFMLIPVGLGVNTVTSSTPAHALSSNEDVSTIGTNPKQLAYDRLSQQRIQLLINSPRYTLQWENRNMAGRQGLAEQFAHEVADMLGLQMMQSVVFFDKDSTHNYRAAFSIADFSIYLYPGLFAGDDWPVAAAAIVHEVRHAYQFEAVYGYLDQLHFAQYGENLLIHILDIDTEEILVTYDMSQIDVLIHLSIPEKTLALWSAEVEAGCFGVDLYDRMGIKEYIERPLEYDAWLYSGQLEVEIFRKTLPGIPNTEQFLESLTPPAL